MNIEIDNNHKVWRDKSDLTYSINYITQGLYYE